MANPKRWQRPFEGALLLACCAGCIGFGVWAQLPLLRAEWPRFSGWQLALLFTADVAGLGFFLRGVWRYVTENTSGTEHERYLAIHYDRFGVSSGAGTPNAKSPAYQKKVKRLYLLGFGIPWLLDVGVSFALREVERTHFREAAIAIGEVRQVEVWEAVKGVVKYRYHLHCWFRDAAGVQHETVQIIETDKHGKFKGGLDPVVQQRLPRRQVPFPIRIAYRADAPYQAWLADLGPGSGWNLHWFSLEVLFGQIFFMGLLILGPLLTDEKTAERFASLPLCLAEVVPMLIEAFWVAACGYFELTLFFRVL